MEIRSYAPSDIREMAALFYDTVHTVNARDYTPAQLDAWATGEVDLAAWDRSFQDQADMLLKGPGRLGPVLSGAYQPGGGGKRGDRGLWGHG